MSTSKLTIALTLITGIIGVVMFFGFAHAGGTPFYTGMVFMPALYLVYKDVIDINNLFILIGICLLIHFAMWCIIISILKTFRDIASANAKHII